MKYSSCVNQHRLMFLNIQVTDGLKEKTVAAPNHYAMNRYRGSKD